MGMLSGSDKQALRTLYESRYAQKGRTHQTVGWGSRADQRLRFEVLLRGLSAKGKRVLDVGCGLGDLVPYLDELTGGDYDYLGVDLADVLVQDARKTFGGHCRRFEVRDILDQADLNAFDLVVASGTFNFRVADNIGYSCAMLQRMWENSRECVSVNFLSSYVDWQDENKNFHYSPEGMFTLAKTLTKYVTLYHDYPLWEFTLQLSRNSRPENQ